MPAKIKFKKSILTHCIHRIFSTNDINKLLYTSIFLSFFASPASFAKTTETQSETTNVSEKQVIDLSKINEKTTKSSEEVKVAGNTQEQLKNAARQQGISNDKIDQLDEKMQEVAQPTTQLDSQAMLEQQEKNIGLADEFKPIQFEDMEELPANSVDPNMANEILKVAEEAKIEAQNFRNGVTNTAEVVVADATQQELTEITQAPVDVDRLMRSIQADSKIVVEANQSGNTLSDAALYQSANNTPEVQLGFVKKIINKIRPPKLDASTVSRISAEVVGAPTPLANNIKGKLSSFTTEAFSDFNSAVPQLRSLSNQAAQAVGYYNAQFKFQKINDSKVQVTVTPNDPVIVAHQNIELSGAGKDLAQLQVIRVLPDLSEGDILNHGAYETTKARIVDAANNNGFFDSYWRLHDVKVEQPQNKADINLRYETGDRYKLGDVEFRMSDPSKPLPIDLKILKSMVTWTDEVDYTAWRVNTLANNLTNSRYFNYTLVDAVKPDPIQKPQELPPDLQLLVDQDKISKSDLVAQTGKEKLNESTKEVTQNVVDEKQFAGTSHEEIHPSAQAAESENKEKETENDRLQYQARAEKKIPVIVTLNADRLNSFETGIGYGTDSGVRVRGQYRRAIVNHLGHSFDANMEVSKIRQAIDARYNIPYKHPLNDYFSLVGGYEREDRGSVGNGVTLVIESAVAGVDRIIKGSRREWQHIIGLRYRLDKISSSGVVNNKDIPDAFLIPGASNQQQSLLLGYEANKTDSDSRLNPTRGYKQSYKIQLGSESALSDASMAIVNTTWKGLYSLGKNDDHQIFGSLELGYIFTDDFDKVPYNLRFFAGGDQRLRGFDYKSLSPKVSGFKVGGQGLAVGSLEYNYQFKDGWRAALFSDFGNAYDKTFSNGTEYSLGLGIRWKSPIGPIRLDVASGISDPGHPIRLHFFIGSQL